MVLRALILIGGYGTRLRPLTFTKPKPLVEFANKPVVIHQIEALAAAGVKEIILAVSYRSKALQQELDYYGKQLGVRIIFSLETEPMGTAGPISLARKHLDEEDKDPFFMLNADVIAHYQFDKLLEFHNKHGHEGTLYVTQVKDPSRYGVVVAKENGQIVNFVEKPTEMKYGNHINAGLYVFNKSMIKRIEEKPTSIEIDIFPLMAKDGELFRLELDSFWMDVGKPSDFIKGQSMYLEAISKMKDSRLCPSKQGIIGNVIIDPSAKFSPTAVIGPDVVIGPNVIIGANVRIKNSTVFANASILDGAFIDGSIVGWKSRIGRWARLQALCILGEDVSIKDEVALVGTIVCPHKEVKENHLKEGDILL